jgi:hypothetical protein
MWRVIVLLSSILVFAACSQDNKNSSSPASPSGGTITENEILNVKLGCNYYGQLQVDKQIYGFASDIEAQDAVKRIMRYTGLPQNFVIMAANVPNAAAVIDYSSRKRLILYSQDFMLRVKDVTRTDWAAVSIVAHEIGHHLSGHTLDREGSRPPMELEADKFSGFILYKMGASLDQAKIAMISLADEEGSSTHPPRSARLAAITNGWVEGKNQGGQLGREGQAEPAAPSQGPRIPGKYPQSSTGYLSESDIISASCPELKIMRNEIFARHGYIFKTYDMRNYFSQQGWHSPAFPDVSDRLSVVEKSNVRFIQQSERRRGCN